MKKRPLRYLTAFYVLILLLVISSSAGAQAQSPIRVWLKRLQIEDAVRIEVQGTYMLEDGTMVFSDGAVLDVVLRGDRLVLHTGQTAVVMGSSMKMLRCDGDVSGGLTLNGNGLYEGDLALDITSDVIRPILHIDVEDYLLGVVPFEMGDSFPLEALKAQAIAARTYALRKSGSSGDYDVEDTTNDQAYHGRTTYSPLSEQAVRETEGLCGAYRGSLAQCFYSASNGGQTELGQHVWPTSDPDAYGYMDMRDDPYDYENDASVVKRFTLTKKPGENGIAPALHSVLVTALADQLEPLGYAAEDDLIRFDEFLLVEAMTPKYEGESRLMTELRFDVKLSVRECLFRDTTQTADTATPSPDVVPSPAPTPSPTPRPTLMPVTADHLEKGEYVAVVTNINEDSSLNLRENPSLSADVLRRLYKDQELIVLSTTQDGWAHVKTDVIEGYVRIEYLQTAEE